MSWLPRTHGTPGGFSNDTVLKLVARMLGGESLALVSDAGTPLLSDPGYRLVVEAVAAGIRVVPIPGPSAITAALCVSGVPTDRFTFEGFLPAKQGARKSRLSELREEQRTLVLFESSHRIVQALDDMAEIFGPERKAAVCREMTKQFETILRGSLDELATRVAADRDQQKGEFVIVVTGHDPTEEESLASGLELAQALLEYLSPTQAAKIAARLTGASRREIYEHIGKQGV
jgi:16S rRNA (cytidine1402-2'-O)-methyltransferase